VVTAVWHPAGVGCAGVLLTGGTSSRMGRDKATLVLDGRTLAARAADVLSAVAAPCVEVGLGVSGLTSVREEPPGSGPLAALAAGVAVVGSSAPALVVACDLPRLDAALLRWLRDHPYPGSVVPVWQDQPQPLCARWSCVALEAVGALVAGGARSMRSLVSSSDVTLVSPPDSLAALLQDVDTPEQLQELTGLDSA
jgi:molybdenum cofactor guanylyltransferase